MEYPLRPYDWLHLSRWTYDYFTRVSGRGDGQRENIFPSVEGKILFPPFPLFLILILWQPGPRGHTLAAYLHRQTEQSLTERGGVSTAHACMHAQVSTRCQRGGGGGIIEPVRYMILG